METFINCIKASGESREARAVGVLVRWWLSKQKGDWVYFLFSGGASADGFSAIKMTALGRPQFLVSLGVLDTCVPDFTTDNLSRSHSSSFLKSWWNGGASLTSWQHNRESLKWWYWNKSWNWNSSRCALPPVNPTRLRLFLHHMAQFFVSAMNSKQLYSYFSLPISYFKRRSTG